MSRDHNCVLAACMDGTLRLLDRADGDLLAEYTGDWGGGGGGAAGGRAGGRAGGGGPGPWQFCRV